MAMKIHSEILGNISDHEWRERAAHAQIEYVDLDQWTAQKSRFVAQGSLGTEYAVALKRRTTLADGDIFFYDDKLNRMAVVRLKMNDIMVIDLGALMRQDTQSAVDIAIELGHALGNQHWPAVVQGSRVYVPLTVDRKVMESVMRTHHIEHIAYSFRPAEQIIPYLAPHEVRRLLGGSHADEKHHHYAE